MKIFALFFYLLHIDCSFQNKILYIDQDTNSLARDGSENLPYKTIMECMAALDSVLLTMVILKSNVTLNEPTPFSGKKVHFKGMSQTKETRSKITLGQMANFYLKNSTVSFENLIMTNDASMAGPYFLMLSNNSFLLLNACSIPSTILFEKLITLIMAENSSISLSDSDFYSLNVGSSALLICLGAQDGISIEILNTTFQSIKQSATSVSPGIVIKNLQASIIIKNTSFLFLEMVQFILVVSGNYNQIDIQDSIISDCWVAKAAFYIENSKIFTLKNTYFVRLNNPKYIRMPGGGSSMILRNTLIKSILNIRILDCYSDLTAVGVKVYDDASVYTLALSLNFPILEMQTTIKESLFQGNYIFYQKNVEIACSLLVLSNSLLAIDNSTFLNNIINSTDTNKQKAGGPCLVSGSNNNILSITKSFFIDNKSRFSSNCLIVSGKATIEYSFFDNNFPVITEPILDAYRKKIGGPRNIIETYGEVSGTIITLADRFVFSKNLLRGSGGFLGGGIFININTQNQRSLYLRVEDSIFDKNLAGYYGGHLFIFEGMIEIIALINNCSFSRGDAHFGGGLSTYWKTKEASILVSSSLFFDNVATYGGAIDISHSSGNCDINNNKMVNNTGFNPASKLGSGAVMKITGTLEVLVKFYKNLFINNYSFYKGNLNFASVRCLDAFSTHVYGKATEGSVSIAILGSGIQIIGMTVFDVISAKNAGCINAKEMTILKITDSYFEGNFAPSNGGVITSSERNFVYLTNVIFRKNIANTGAVLIAYENFNEFGSEIVFRNCLFDSNIAREADVISITDTTISFYNCVFENHNTSMISSLSSNMKFENTTARNFLCSTDRTGCLFYLQSNTKMLVTKMNISLVNSKTEGTVFYSEQSTVNISQLVAFDISSQSLGALVYGTNSTILLMLCSLKKYSSNCIYSIWSKLSIDSSKFEANETGIVKNGQNSIGCVYIHSPSDRIIINNSLFTSNNLSISGGAVYLYSDAESAYAERLVIIENTIFLKNGAFEFGGAIYILEQAFEINNCTFLENRARSGGALFFEAKNESLVGTHIVRGSKFVSNFGEEEGGAFKWTARRLGIENVEFKNNVAFYGADEAAFPMNLMLTVRNKLDSMKGGLTDYSEEGLIYSSFNKSQGGELQSLVSGKEINHTFIFEVVDYFNKTITTLNGGSLDIEFLEENSTNPEENWDRSGYVYISKAVIINKGRAILENFKVVIKPTSTIIVKFSTSYIKKYYKSNLTYDISTPNRKNIKGFYHFLLSMNFRGCLVGEILQKSINNCYKCPEGKYSIVDPESALDCITCFSNAVCLGGDSVRILKGYWRLSKLTDLAYDCKMNSDFCLGGEYSTCEKGYTGALCGACDVNGPQKYSRIAKYCVECPSFVLNLFRTLFAFSGFFCLVGFMVYVAIRDANRITADNSRRNISLNKFFSIYLKLFLNYIQVVSVITSMDLRWPLYARTFTEAQSNVGNVPSHVISIECLLMEYKLSSPVIYYRALTAALIPVLLMSLFIGFLVFYWMIKHKSQFTNIIVSFVVVNVFLQPTVLKELTDILSCTKIYDNKFFVTRSMDLECYTTEHNSWSYILAYPALAYWIILYPLGCLFYLMKNSKNLDDITIRRRMGFFMSGYKKKYFYWEFVIMYRKVFVVFCSIILDLSPMIRATFLLLVSGISLYLTKEKKPFAVLDLNELELKSNISAFITLYSGMLYLNTDNEFSKALFFTILVITNVVFLYYWAKSLVLIFFSAKAQKVYDMCPRFFNIVFAISDAIQQVKLKDGVRKSIDRLRYFYQKSMRD